MNVCSLVYTHTHVMKNDIEMNAKVHNSLEMMFRRVAENVFTQFI